MSNTIIVLQMPFFKRVYKKLHFTAMGPHENFYRDLKNNNP